MKSFRGISLQDIVGKSVLKTVILHAKAQCYEQLIEWPQFGYMTGRSTSDAILRVYLHEQKVLRLCRSAEVTPHQRRAGQDRAELAGGLQLCLDLSMAFDQVSRAVLLQAMLLSQMSQDVIALVNNWHIATPYCHGDIEVDANRGVRQGCVAAPLVWVIYTMHLMQSLSFYIPVVCILAWLTMYADDIHWGQVFRTEDELKEVLHLTRSFLDFLALFGVIVNMQKSAILFSIKGKRAAKWRSKLIRRVQGQMHLRLPAIKQDDEWLDIPLVKEHLYLGVRLGYAKTQKATFRHRSRLARGTFVRLAQMVGHFFPP